MNKFNLKNMVRTKLEDTNLEYLQLIEDQVIVLPMDYASMLKYHKGAITDQEFMWYNNLEKIKLEEIGLEDELYEMGFGVKDFFIPKQEVTASTCKEDATDWKCQLYKSNCYIWGHSHVNMQPNPSPQDIKETEEQLDLCFSALEEGEHTYFIRLIMNKKMEVSVAGYLIYNYKGVKITEEVDFDILLSETSIEDVTDTEDKIKKEVRTVYNVNNSNKVGFNNSHNIQSITANNKKNHVTKHIDTNNTNNINKTKKYEIQSDKDEIEDGYNMYKDDYKGNYTEMDQWYGL